jgi:hypothetical protein
VGRIEDGDGRTEYTRGETYRTLREHNLDEQRVPIRELRTDNRQLFCNWHWQLVQEFRPILEVHGIVVVPFATPNKAVTLEDLDDAVWDPVLVGN